MLLHFHNLFILTGFLSLCCTLSPKTPFLLCPAIPVCLLLCYFPRCSCTNAHPLLRALMAFMSVLASSSALCAHTYTNRCPLVRTRTYTCHAQALVACCYVHAVYAQTHTFSFPYIQYCVPVRVCSRVPLKPATAPTAAPGSAFVPVSSHVRATTLLVRLSTFLWQCLSPHLASALAFVIKFSPC